MPHIHEKIDFTAEVFVVYGNKVLLRKHDKYKIWLSVGGHIELNEDPNQAAIREVKEEVGLNITLSGKIPKFREEGDDYKELIPPISMNRHRINPTHEHITLVFFAKSDTDRIKTSKEEVSEECKWFNKAEIDSGSYEIKESIKYYAKMALERINSQ
ncbi:MAG: NUDIX domain-containing protein [Candidatus Micrarchaeaceae archaeon]|jgi:ADP-ribose pyrophosphatase YjhB (NUDIX family)